MHHTEQNAFAILNRWLEWLDSHDGRLTRRKRGDKETDSDFLATIPTPPTQSILTVGDLRALVEAGHELNRLRSKEYQT